MKKVSLKVKCPHCYESLIDENMLINNRYSIKVNIENSTTRGAIWLSSIYDDFTHTSNVELNKDELFDFFCPHCNQSLKRQINCEICESPIISFNTSIGGKVSFCSKHGCKNHYLVFDNLENQVAKFYDEYGF